VTERAVHLYFHVPFCARRCSYCDFAIAVRRTVPSAEYRAAVATEWERWQGAPWWADAGPIETIYFGGGTPSMLDPESVGDILERVAGRRSIATGVEITLEVNPEDVSLAKARGWLAAGVNRVSLGIQSFDPAVLLWMHRVHSADQASRAVDMLRTAGVDNLSLDLIYAVPEALERSWDSDLARALASSPEHLSIYGLTVEPATPLGRWVGRGEVVVRDSDAAAGEYLLAHQQCAAAGLEFYEVSNAARPGHGSRHNQAYWRGKTYLGLGPSAHSHHAGHRWWNVRDWKAYQAAIMEDTTSIAGEERLDAAQIELEKLYLGLRTTLGISASYLPQVTAQQWFDAGWARLHGSQVVLTPEGWLRLDLLVRQVAGS
jgi:oxygen-independent coproporphyrinogen-3 oxidase